MKIEVENIKVAARIRKLTARIDELAQDIQKNGLINPITVMAAEGGYQLLAGLRRLRAAQSLGWAEIEATVAAPKDAEAALLIEHSENVQREQFTFSEKMDYARLIEEIESAKARERMSLGGQGGLQRAHLGETEAGNDALPPSRTNAIVGPKIGMSRATYTRAKFVAKNAPSEVIERLDNGEKTITGAYAEIRKSGEKNMKAEPNEPTSVPTAAKVSAAKPALLCAPETDLQRAIRAESELDAFKYRQHNEIFHRDSIIENLKNRVAELEAALEVANTRIQELEGALPKEDTNEDQPI